MPSDHPFISLPDDIRIVASRPGGYVVKRGRPYYVIHHDDDAGMLWSYVSPSSGGLAASGVRLVTGPATSAGLDYIAGPGARRYWTLERALAALEGTGEEATDADA